MTFFQKFVRDDFMFRTAENVRRMQEHCDRLQAAGFYAKTKRKRIGDVPAQSRIAAERDRKARAMIAHRTGKA